MTASSSACGEFVGAPGRRECRKIRVSVAEKTNHAYENSEQNRSYTEELTPSAVAHLAEPVETSALQGRRRRAKTDRADARWLRDLLVQGRLPEA